MIEAKKLPVEPHPINWDSARYPQRRPWAPTQLDSLTPVDPMRPADRERYIPFRRRSQTPDSPIMVDAAQTVVEARRKQASGEEPTLHEMPLDYQ